MDDFPIYLKTRASGGLDKKVKELKALLKACTLCPRKCRVDRTAGQVGYCKASDSLSVSSAFPHFGEESPLVGFHGSGTIFFSHCNLKCIFCQNYDISIEGDGQLCSENRLAEIMVELQRRGCHNINFVTPTHYVPHLVEAVGLAADSGLRIPIVYNCGGYESLEVIKLLEGIVDIYMPDIKFLDPCLSSRFCNAKDYPDVVKEVVKEMHRQVGGLVINEHGIATRGLLLRHLVMPSCLEDTKRIMRFVREEVSTHAFVNIMAQYHPCCRAEDYPEIARRISHREYQEALGYAQSIGLSRAASH